MKIKVCFIVLLVFVLNKPVFSQTISIETQSSNFFLNVVLDSLLLMDGDIQNILAPDFSALVKKASFVPRPNSWIPGPHPKGVLSNIYRQININNLADSFTSMVSQVVEMSCRPQQYDPLSTYSSKCVAKTLKYPIINEISIDYNYVAGNGLNEILSKLQNSSTDTDRYQNIVIALADLVNSGYAKNTNKNMSKQISIIKYPLPLAGSLYSTVANGSSGEITDLDVQNEKRMLESEIDGKRIACTNVTYNKRERQECDEALKDLRYKQELLNTSPESYLAYKQQSVVNEQLAESRREKKMRNIARDEAEKRSMNSSLNGPIVSLPNGNALNTATGEVLQKNPHKGYTGTQSGAYYETTHGGLLNTQTGNITPVAR
ncbi:MAG: hypothetical protein AB7U43_05600 [Desulfobacter sp.]